MRNCFVVTFALLPILNISSYAEAGGISISQEKCNSYQDRLQPSASKNFPFLARVYNGYYFNEELIIQNKVEFSNGVIVSEDFVLTIANNGLESLLFVEILTLQLEVIQKITNQQQNIMLLKLSAPITFNDQIQPACLPQPQTITLLQIICWVDSGWLNQLKLKRTSRGNCKQGSVDYIKRIRVQGIYNGSSFCASVVEGDRDRCNVPGSILLNNYQEVIGVAIDSSVGHRQTFVELSEHVAWIEDIVWTSESTSTTTEQTTEPFAKNESPTPTIYVLPASATADASNSNVTSRVDVELHEIHKFLNVNLVLIVVLLFLVLCISSILWSDGLCIRAVLPSESSTVTDV